VPNETFINLLVVTNSIMEHLAIMNKSWGLIPKILRGEKTIESRWYSRKIAPWDAISTGDLIYFKDAGRPVTARAEVSAVQQFSDLNPDRIRNLLDDYIERIGFQRSIIDDFMERIQGKRYGILVSLQNPREIEPFEIDKTSFGIGSAWLTVESIDKLRK